MDGPRRSLGGGVRRGPRLALGGIVNKVRGAASASAARPAHGEGAGGDCVATP